MVLVALAELCASMPAEITAAHLGAAYPGRPYPGEPLSAGPATDAVTRKLTGRAEAARPHRTAVTVTRRHGFGWVFGTAVLTAPPEPGDYPDGWIFLARRDRDGWQVRFDGEPGFAELATAAPLLSNAERNVFAGPGARAGDDRRTGMRLPFAVGQTWSYTGGPHEMGGLPRSSIDLAGGDLKVRAARAGTAYTMCQGWIRVVHDRGYATDYYHLWNQIPADRTPVAEGEFLGDAGTDVSCGGAATGRHVHFSLRRHDRYVPIAGHGFGGWVIYRGAEPYQGYALHGSTRVDIGGRLTNRGALGPDQGIVDTDGGGVLHRRAGPGTGHAVVGALKDGATVTISCSANGTEHDGRYGPTSLWNRLPDNTWVSDAYIWTGMAGPVSGWCPSRK